MAVADATEYCWIERDSEPRWRSQRYVWRAEDLALQENDGETVDEPATADDESARKPRTLAALPKDARLGAWVKDTYGQLGYVSGFYYRDIEVCYPNKGHDVDQHRAVDLEVLDLPRVDLPVTVPKPEAVKPTRTLADVDLSQWKGLRIRANFGGEGIISEVHDISQLIDLSRKRDYVIQLKDTGPDPITTLRFNEAGREEIVILDDTEEATE
ncbi:hypothetical protein OS128_05260 [Corynebacterium sp. P5848]|uniref:hypothetical protein n=1 Tax=Corynebacterium marambiense TaxID=2765364 RepID=UPI0022609842|nr:hypothetical protein [Corynebacterium marambiense]MCX7542319.1 hypothetical protein [Corynebacterium marambiense]